ARLGEALHMLEHRMDVYGFALDRPLVREYFHAVDELHDAVGLITDQSRQATVVIADRLLEQLSRPADAGERVLDLVREHGRERNHGTRSAAMGELAVHLVGNRALLQHHYDMIRSLRQRRNVEIDQAFTGIARCAEIDLVLIDCSATTTHLLAQ